MAPLTSPRGVLLDIDGVLQVSMRPLEGAAQTLHWLTQNGYSFCCVTNTTTLARSTLTQRLQDIGLPITIQQIITAPVATANYIHQHHTGKRCWVLTKGETAEDFAGIPLTREDAEVVVIGGAEELLTYENMNHAFRLIMQGAVFLAMHANLYWRTSDGLRLDSGPFVHALEVATGQQAVVLGKPNAGIFEQGIVTMGLSASQTIMVGDDIENDVAAAQRAGLRGVLVCTGKHSADSPLLKNVRPDAILPSIAELPAYLQES